MRCVRRAVAGALALVLCTALFWFAQPAAANRYPPGSVDMVPGSASVTQTPAGSRATFMGSGFVQRSVIKVAVDGRQRIVVTSSARGTFSVSMAVEGNHILTATGFGAAGRPRVVSATVSTQAEEAPEVVPGVPGTPPGSAGVYVALLMGLGSIAVFVALLIGARVLHRMPQAR